MSYWESNNTDPAFNSGVQIDLQAGTANSVYYGNDVLRNIQIALEAAGATMADVVWTTVFTTDMREFREIVAAREEFWRDNLPTSTMIEINHLTEPAAKIEVQVIAAVA